MPWNNGTRKKKRYLTVLIWIVILTIFDQLSKIAADQFLKFREPFVLIRNVFQLEYLENRGAAFGMMQNMQYAFIAGAVAVCIIILFLYIKMPHTFRYLPLRICAVLLFAGAVGNMIDRIRLNYVIDFFYFRLIDFPIFNVADCYVVIACVVFAFLILFYYRDENDFNFLSRKKG